MSPSTSYQELNTTLSVKCKVIFGITVIRTQTVLTFSGLRQSVVVESPARPVDMRTSICSRCATLLWYSLQKGDHVRVHIVDAAEASLFLQEGRFLTGVVVGLKAAHDSSLVEVVGLGGVEVFLVPNTRLEIVAPEDSARVVDIFELERNQVRSDVRGYCT